MVKSLVCFGARGFDSFDIIKDLAYSISTLNNRYMLVRALHFKVLVML